MKALTTLRAMFERERWRKIAEDRHRLMVSFWGCIAFIGLGSSLVVFGPTLLDVASHLSVGVGSLAFMFAIRAVGGVLGSVGSGFILDRLGRFSYTMMVGILLAAIITTSIVPLSVHIVMLGFLMFCNGVATGSLDNGMHAVLMKMWKDNAGPCMQILHFSFALGAFFAPLLAKPFISEENSDEPSSTSVSSCVKLFNETPFTFDNESQNTSDSFETNCTLLLAACSNLSTNYSLGSVYVDSDLVISSNCSNTTDAPNPNPENNGSLLFAWAYWISAAFFVPPLSAFIYYAVRRELLQRFRKSISIRITASQDVDREEQNDSETPEIGGPEEVVQGLDGDEQNDSETPEIESAEEEVQDVDKEETNNIETENPEEIVSMKQSLRYQILLLTLLFLFMLFYVGLEVAFGSFIFTVAVKGELQFSKQKAALLASVFWGTFAFTRLFSVALALLRTPASWMMTGNMTGSLLAATIMVTFPHNAMAIWIGAALLGTSYASIYPTTMTWFAEHVVVTGRTTAVVITGGTLGDIALPAAVGFLVGHVTPESLIYFTFVGILVSAVFLVLLFLSAYIERKRRRRPASIASVRYTKVTEDGSENGLVVDGGGLVADDESSDEVRLLDNEEL